MHRNLAFPLLKALTEAGDIKASHMFKEEIISRFSEGNSTVNFYLINEGYLDYFDENELELIALDPELQIIKNLILVLDPLFREDEFLADNCVVIIERLAQNDDIKSLLQKVIIDLLDFESDKITVEIISYELYKYLDSRDLKKLFKPVTDSRFFDNIKTILFGTGRKYNFYSKNPSFIFSMFILFFAVMYRRIGNDPILKLINSLGETHKISFRLKLSELLEDFHTLEFYRYLRNDRNNVEDFLNELVKLV